MKAPPCLPGQRRSMAGRKKKTQRRKSRRRRRARVGVGTKQRRLEQLFLVGWSGETLAQSTISEHCKKKRGEEGFFVVFQSLLPPLCHFPALILMISHEPERSATTETRHS